MFPSRPAGRRSAQRTTSPKSSYSATGERPLLVGHRWSEPPPTAATARPWVRNGPLALAVTGFVAAIALSQAQGQIPVDGGAQAARIAETPAASTTASLDFRPEGITSRPGHQSPRFAEDSNVLEAGAGLSPVSQEVRSIAGAAGPAAMYDHGLSGQAREEAAAVGSAEASAAAETAPNAGAARSVDPVPTGGEASDTSSPPPEDGATSKTGSHQEETSAPGPGTPMAASGPATTAASPQAASTNEPTEPAAAQGATDTEPASGTDGVPPLAQSSPTATPTGKPAGPAEPILLPVPAGPTPVPAEIGQPTEDPAGVPAPRTASPSTAPHAVPYQQESVESDAATSVSNAFAGPRQNVPAPTGDPTSPLPQLPDQSTRHTGQPGPQ